jgi:hypothetical protein
MCAWSYGKKCITYAWEPISGQLCCTKSGGCPLANSACKGRPDAVLEAPVRKPGLGAQHHAKGGP